MSAAETLDDTLTAALWAAGRGFLVHPLDHPSLPTCVGVRTFDHNPKMCTQRGKHPATTWSEAATRDEKTIYAEFAGATRNVGLAVPPGLVIIDEDRPGGLLKAATDSDARLPQTLTWTTGRGRHYVFQLPKGVIHGNAVGTLKALYGCDVRGKGGYVVGPGSLHETGVIYTCEAPDAPIALIPEWLYEIITTRPASTTGTGALASIPDLIPGPRNGQGGDRHQVLVSYACSLRARAVPLIEAQVLYRQVWEKCEQPPACATPLTWEEARGKLEDVYHRYPEGRSEEFTADELTTISMPTDKGENGGRASWARVDLTAHLDGTYIPPAPALMPRADGACLLYVGLTHSLHGESESGKSWVAQCEAARCIQEGQAVLYVDFESDAGSIVERFILLGCSREQIAAHLDYRQPEASPTAAHELEAWQDMLAGRYTLAVIDGVTDAMGLFGKKVVDNDEIAAWMRAFPRQLARRTRAAVVMIDHVTKDKESRGRFAIGGQAKMAGLTGAAYTVDVVDVLGKGLRGVLSLRVAKDRPGEVRGKAGPMRKTDRTQEAARFILDSTGQTLSWALETPAGLGGTPLPAFRPTHLMERVSRFVEDNPGASKRTIEADVSGKAAAVRVAVDTLVSEGYVRREMKGQATLHHPVKPFREFMEQQLGESDD